MNELLLNKSPIWAAQNKQWGFYVGLMSIINDLNEILWELSKKIISTYDYKNLTKPIQWNCNTYVESSFDSFYDVITILKSSYLSWNPYSLEITNHSMKF